MSNFLKPKAKRKKISMELDVELLEKIQQLCEKNNLTFRHVVEYSLEKTLEQYGQEVKK